MERELAAALKNVNKRKAMDSVAANNDIALPEAPVEREANYLMEQAKNNLRNQGLTLKVYPLN